MHDLTTRATLAAADELRYGGYSRAVVAMMLIARSFSSRRAAGSAGEAIEHLTSAARLTGNNSVRVMVERMLRRRLGGLQLESIVWERHFPLANERAVKKAIVLKQPQPSGEKGVLFIAFEENWVRLLRFGNLDALRRDYDLVLSPTWSPPHDFAMLIAAKMWEGPLFTIASNFDDVSVFPRLAPNLHCVPLLASSWVNPDLFVPAPEAEKQYDLCVVANFARYKRHFALFRALPHTSRPLRVAIIGRGWDGRHKEDLEREADLYGARPFIEIIEGPSNDEMIRVMQSSRAFTIMSLGEGSCVAVAEAMFAGLPAGLLERARIGSKAFIGPDSGRLLRASHLAEDLVALVDAAPTLRPRQHMMDNRYHCFASTSTLNDALRESARARHLPWTHDIAAMQWRPNAAYVNAADAERLAPAYVSFEERYGVPVVQPEFVA